MPEHHPAALPKGHRIGEYEIVRVLGAGGFGITYLAFDLHLDGPVAIKEYFPAAVATRIDGWRVAAALPENRAVFTWGLDRFIHEARSIHRFRHPNVVRAHRYVEAHGTAYIVMEYVEGESLEEVLNQRGSLPAPAWRRWLHPLLDGLAHVHGHGYLHRDIKPANIVIRAADREPVLIDFGAARVAAREQTHTRVLTPGYAPIEQHSGQAVQGPPADIYALAAVSYRVLTGSPPPDAPDRMIDDRYEPLSPRVINADRTWLAAIDRGLQPRPEHRPQTVAAWRAALTEAHDDPAGTDAEPAAPEPSRRPSAEHPSEAAAPHASPFPQDSRSSDDHKGSALSDEQYQAAKPYFQAAWREAQKSEWEFGYFVRELAKFLMEQYDVDMDTAFDVVNKFQKEQVAHDRESAAGPGRPADAGTEFSTTDEQPLLNHWIATMPSAARQVRKRRRESPGLAGPQQVAEARQTDRPATPNPSPATEPRSDSTRRDAHLRRFESFSRLTGRTIAYGGAHAVPIDRDSPISSHNGYVDLMEACYLDPCEEPELSLPEQEESLLMTFYSMYSALQCGDHGFDRLADDVLDSLGDEDDHNDYDSYESWRDEEFKEIEGHLVRGLERCGEDRTESSWLRQLRRRLDRRVPGSSRWTRDRRRTRIGRLGSVPPH